MLQRSSIVALSACLAASAAAAQSIERISVASGGAEGDAASSSVTRASDDGRFVAFESLAGNLFAGDVPGTSDVFVRDRELGTTVRVRGAVELGDLSGDGRLLAYTDTSGAAPAAFLLDLGTGFATPLNPSGTSADPRFSGDALTVVYVKGDAATAPTVLVRKALATGAEDLVSQTTGGTPNTLVATAAAVAYDGSLVAFTSADPALVGSDGNGVDDAFYRDFAFGFTDRFSQADGGAELLAPSLAGAFSADTRFFLFSSDATDVVPDDTNGVSDLFALDRFLGGVIALSIDPLGALGNGATSAAGAWMSADGERVVFASDASDLVAGDGNGARDVFELDMGTGTTRRLVLGLGGAEPDAAVELVAVTPDGRYLALVSAASNLVPGDTNSVADVFLVDLGPQCSIGEVCDALPNSTGNPASIGATGTASFGLNNLVLSSTDLPDAAVCIYFMSATRVDPPLSFGNGLLCVGGAIERLGQTQAVGGNVIQFQDLAGAAFAGVAPGDVRTFQLWYRDLPAGASAFNTSAALEVAFCP